MDEVILTLDYSNKEQSNKVLETYEQVKNDLNEEMERWEVATESLSQMADN